MNAAIYTRVSTPGQAKEEAVSLDEQERVCLTLCQREGWEVVEHYQDAGLSATSDTLDNRPALQRLLRDAAAGRFSRLVVYHTDRLARNTEAASLIASVLKVSKVLVASPSQGTLDLSDLQSKLIYLIGGWSAEAEAQRIRERCDAGRRGYARRGDFPVWQEPFGYKWQAGDLKRGIPNRLLPIPEQLATVREVFALTAEGGMIGGKETRRGLSVREVTAEMNRRALLTRGGKRWYPADIQKMLADPRYMGRWIVWAEGEGADRVEYPARPDLIPEQAVSEATWRRAQKVRAHHKFKTRRPMKHAHLLNGLLYCTECGSAMIGHQIHDAPVLRYYVCSKKQANEGKPCRARYVPAEPLEAEAWALVEELAAHPETARAYAEATRQERLPGLREEAARIERAIRSAQGEVDGLLRALARDEITGADVARLRPSLEADIAAWRERLSEVERQTTDAEMAERAVEEIAGLLGGLPKRLSDLDLRERRWLLAQLDFRMDLGCEDWRAKSWERRYHVLSRWAGADLLTAKPTRATAGLSKKATRVIAGDPFALPM